MNRCWAFHGHAGGVRWLNLQVAAALVPPSNARQCKTPSSFPIDCCYRVARRSDQARKLFVGDLQTLANDPDLHAIGQVEPIARASDVASLHCQLLCHDSWRGQVQAGFRPPGPCPLTARFREDSVSSKGSRGDPKEFRHALNLCCHLWPQAKEAARRGRPLAVVDELSELGPDIGRGKAIFRLASSAAFAL